MVAKATWKGRGALAAAVVAILVAVVLAAAPAPRAAEEEKPLDPKLHEALKAPVLEKIKELDKVKDDKGINTMHGSYYDDFEQAGEGYQVVFFTREAKPDELIVRRYRLTLAADGSGGWKIANEELEHTVEGILYRSVPGDETFHAFDSVDISREGLRLSGGAGTLIIDYWHGTPYRLWFDAQNLRYDYDFPGEFGFYQTVYKRQVEKHPKDIRFDPGYVLITCDDGRSCQRFLDDAFGGVRDSDIASLGPRLRKTYDKFLEDQEKARKDQPMSHFSVVPEPDRVEWRMWINRDGSDDHFATLDFDSYRRNEVEFSVSAIGGTPQFGYPMFAYASEATKAAGVDAYDLENRPDLDNLYYDVKGFGGEVSMAVESVENMTCDFTYDLEVKKAFRLLPFYISQLSRRPGQTDPPSRPTINVITMEDGEGNPLTYVRLNAFFGLIVFPEELQPGHKLTLRTNFQNQKALFAHNHDYLRVSREGWAPLISFTDKIDNFDLEITVPDRYQILGIDHKVSEETRDGLRIAHYTSDFPLTFPTIIFGNYNSAESGIAAAKADGTKIPVWVHVDKTSMLSFQGEVFVKDMRDVEERISDLDAGVRDIRKGSLQPIADQAVNAINLYREIYGVDYPFDKMDLVADPLGSFYGQAPPSIVYLGFGVFYPKARVNVGSAGDITSFQNSVVAHEVGHQWWGSLVVNKNFGNYWFVESLAEYSSALYTENLAGFGVKDPKKAAEARWKGYMASVDEWRRFLDNYPDQFVSVQHSDTMFPGGDPLFAQRTAAIYNKGPLAFHMLRMTFGEEKFFRFLKELAQELQRSEIVTRDIQRIAERSLCGEDANGNPCAYDLEWFFDQWIRGVGLPEYSFNYQSWQAEDRNWVVKGTVKQRVVLGREKRVIPGAAFRGKTSVTVIGKDKKEYPVELVINGEETPFIFKVPVEPAEIVLNKNREMLNAGIVENRDF